jgi:dienelactone hydrolase
MKPVMFWVGLVAVTAASTQEPHFAFPAPSPDVRVAMNVEYARVGSERLAMDMYSPAAAAGARVPALVFFNGATGADRSQRFYAAWARTAASNGLVGILPDLRAGTEVADFNLLVAYLAQHAADHGIDGIAVYSGSGNVVKAFPAVEDPKQTAITAAVMYYGAANLTQFRLDLPVLYVRAGLDRPSMNESIDALAALALAQNAPLTLLNHAGGHHAFEMVDDDAATRGVIEETLRFVKRATSAPYQASLRASLAEATASSYVRTRRFHQATAEYGRLVAGRPDDARLRLAYGEALLGDSQYASACAEFDKVRDKGLGYRDLGLPAARACLQKGDPDAAIGWLRSIPPQFLPASVATDPAFAALQNRADFQALFTRR